MKYVNAKKKVLSVHGVYSEQVDALHSETTANMASLAESRALKWADKLSTDSKIVKKNYKEKNVAEKMNFWKFSDGNFSKFQKTIIFHNHVQE